jgi:hypothetical protein
VCFFGGMGFYGFLKTPLLLVCFRVCVRYGCARVRGLFPRCGLSYHGISFQNLNDFGSLEGGDVYVYVDFFRRKNHFAGYFPSVVLLLLL